MLFARKDETVSTLQSKYNGGTGAMSIDDYARWLSRVTLAVAIIMIGWGLSVILIQPVTAWFATSSIVWMALLLISAIWQLRASFRESHPRRALSIQDLHALFREPGDFYARHAGCARRSDRARFRCRSHIGNVHAPGGLARIGVH